MNYYSIVVDFTEDRNIDILDRSTIDWRLSKIYYSGDIDGKMVDKSEKNEREHEDLIVSKYLGHGIIRLFKCSDSGEKSRAMIGDRVGTGSHNDFEETVVIPGDDTMVCMLFVPTYFTLHELLHFYIGDDIINNQVANFRIIKHYENGSNNLGFNFMILIKFRESCHAKQFREEFNGKKFSKVDPETCHVVAIKELVFNKYLLQKNITNQDSTDDNRCTFPYLLKDPFTSIRSRNGTLNDGFELPTCPVCLEKMDSKVSGLITIPCSHTFHCQCLDKWKNSKCPVCRHSNMNLSRAVLIRENNSNSKCSVCDFTDNLWICLICGNIGCGRYNSKHAIHHYETTSHCFAMDMRTQRVWDYAGDNYVHRLVQNEVDGKLVEVSGLNNNFTTSEDRSKNENLATNFMRNKEYHLEYVQVLISQLESQREYYEIKLQQANMSRDQCNHIDDLKNRITKLKLDLTEKENKFKNETKVVQDELKTNNLLITGFQENLDKSEKIIEDLKVDKKKLEDENNSLQEQLQDLMFYLDTQEKFKDATEEEKEGEIIIKQSYTTGTDSAQKTDKKKKKKKKKKKIGNSNL